MVDKAVFLSPEGTPRPKQQWAISHHATFADVRALLKMLLVRNITIPNVARWNSLEVYEYYILGLASFDFVDVIVADCYLNFWPDEGEDSDFTEPEMAEKAKSKRAESVRPFVQGDGNLWWSIIVAVTEIPRFHLLRTMCKNEKIDGQLVGIQRALSNCIDDTRKIIASEDVFANHVIFLGLNQVISDFSSGLSF